MSKVFIDGKEAILLPVSALDIAGNEIHKVFYLSKRHMDYVKAQSFVMLWVKRGVQTMKNKKGEDIPAYALTKEEYNFFTKLFNDAKSPI